MAHMVGEGNEKVSRRVESPYFSGGQVSFPLQTRTQNIPEIFLDNLALAYGH